MRLSEKNVWIRIAQFGHDFEAKEKFKANLTLCRLFWTVIGKCLLLSMLVVLCGTLGYKLWINRWEAFKGILGVALVVAVIALVWTVGHFLSWLRGKDSFTQSVPIQTAVAWKKKFCPFIEVVKDGDV